MNRIKQISSFILLMASLLVFAPATFAESAHDDCNKTQNAQKVLSDPRLPIVFGSLVNADPEPRVQVRVPQPRRR